MDGVNLSGKAVRIAFRQNLEEGTSRLIFKLFEWLVELVDQRSICSSIADGHNQPDSCEPNIISIGFCLNDADVYTRVPVSVSHHKLRYS